MPKNSHSYLTEKFYQAVCDLATGEGDARARLGVAFYRFWIIPLEDYPMALRGDREKITQLITRLGGPVGYIIPENLRRMKNRTAGRIADLILHLYLDLLRAEGGLRVAHR